MKKKVGHFISFNSVKINAVKNKENIIDITSSVIDSGEFLNGRQNEKLCKSLKYFLDNKGYLLTTGSGHDSLQMALSALKLKPDDEIIFSANAYPTAFPVCLSAGKPVACDVDRNGQIDPYQLEKKINPKTKAVIITHLYGLVGEIDKIKRIISKNHIILIEDCAQSFGSKYKDIPIGTLGDISCFSFYPTKHLGTLGDGGAIWTKHKNYFDFFLQAKSYGERDRYFSDFICGHSRLPEIQAGILNIYIKKLKTVIKKKKILEKYYIKQIRERKLDKNLQILKSDPNSNPNVHLFVVKARNRDLLKDFLKKKRIETQIHYPHPINTLPAFSYLGYKEGDFPVSEELAREILSLPFHSYLGKREIDKILNTIEDFYKIETSGFPSKKITLNKTS